MDIIDFVSDEVLLYYSPNSTDMGQLQVLNKPVNISKKPPLV